MKRFKVTTNSIGDKPGYWMTCLFVVINGQFTLLGNWEHLGKNIPDDVQSEIDNLKTQNQ